MVAVGHLPGVAAHHLRAVGAQVGPRGLVIYHQVGHAADGRGRRQHVRRPVRDGKPRGISTVGRTRDAHLAALCGPLLYQRLDASPYVGLLAPAPAVLFDRLAVRQAEARTAPVVGVEHVEPLAHEELYLAVYAVLAVACRPAMNVDHRAPDRAV